MFRPKLFKVYYVCLLHLFFLMSESILYPKSRCEKNDCSYQIPDTKDGDCIIHNTSTCKDSFYKFSPFSERELSSEGESKFSVSIIPYSADVFDGMRDIVSAINITFAVHFEEVKGLAVNMIEKASSFDVCRILDFQSVNNSKILPMHLFYDCFNSLVEGGIQNVLMNFVALPMNEKLSYYVFIPGTKIINTCYWKPVIMVFCGSLLRGDVQVKFSQAPKGLNISFYTVKLIKKLSDDEILLTVPADLKRSMMSVEFVSVEEGIYSVSVKSITKDGSECWVRTEFFDVGSSEFDPMLIYVCVLTLLIFSALVFLKMFAHNVYKLRIGSEPRILLFYSYDCKEHEEFIIAFTNYMVKQYPLQVCTIYGTGGDPREWIINKYKECNVIMFVISEGLFHALDKEEKKGLHLKKGHEWQKQLLWATDFISTQLFNSAQDFKKKKICKVCFKYSKKEHVPDHHLTTDTRRFYMLPSEMNDLLNFLYGCQPYIACAKLCPLYHTNFESSTEGNILNEKFKAIKAAVDNKTHMHIIKLLSDTAQNNLNSSDVYHEGSIHQEEYSNCSDSSEENSNASSIELQPPNASKTKAYSKNDLLCQSLSSSNSSSKNEDFTTINLLESSGDSDEEKSDLSNHVPEHRTDSDVKSRVNDMLLNSIAS